MLYGNYKLLQTIQNKTLQRLYINRNKIYIKYHASLVQNIKVFHDHSILLISNGSTNCAQTLATKWGMSYLDNCQKSHEELINKLQKGK